MSEHEAKQCEYYSGGSAEGLAQMDWSRLDCRDREALGDWVMVSSTCNQTDLGLNRVPAATHTRAVTLGKPPKLSKPPCLSL